MSVIVSNLIIMCTNTSIYLMKFISQMVLECGRILIYRGIEGCQAIDCQWSQIVMWFDVTAAA